MKRIALIVAIPLAAMACQAKPPSPEALSYLTQAINILRAHHINSRRVDWPRLITDARADIAGAKTPADTYPAIRELIDGLGERHTVLIPPPDSAQIDTTKASPEVSSTGVEVPTSTLLDGQVGVVRLPGINTLKPAGVELGNRYSNIVKATLKRLDKVPLCGWIVDLRENTGGNMWPMLAGLDPLLGKPPFGFFVSTDGAVQPWTRAPRGIAPTAIRAGPPAPPAFALTHASAPVAVLIGPRTTSSGEMTALALIGRPGVRTFGSRSGGFLSGNKPYLLSDGAYIAVTEVLVRDRTSKIYKDKIQPDVPTDPYTSEDSAKSWIEQQCQGTV